MRRFFFLCPSVNTPYGGIKIIYRHVEILNDLGIKAFVYHEKPGFKINWFKTNAPLAYPKRNWFIREAPLCSEDFMVLPEYNLLKTVPLYKKYPYLVFNQNAYLTFNHTKLPSTPFKTLQPLKEYEESRGIITVSEDNLKIMKALYPSIRSDRVVLSVENFLYSNDKKKLIAFSPIKEPKQAYAVISLLSEKIKGWTFAPLINMNEEKVKETLKEAALFLNFTHPEGFGLPAIEALKSGALVIGYDGRASLEYLKAPYARTVGYGDWTGFRDEALRLIELFENKREEYVRLSKEASEAVSAYNGKNERDSLKSAYSKYL